MAVRDTGDGARLLKTMPTPPTVPEPTTAPRWRLPISPVWWLLLLGGLVLAGGIFRLQGRARALEAAREQEQQLRCDELARRVDQSLLAARQLTQTLATLGALSGGAPSATERLLSQMMLSVSDELIYGMGLWYARGTFGPGTLYGPYLHRPKGAGGLRLTYEWSTQQYNYPERPWYRQALADPTRQSYTEPYPDGDEVYVSSVAAMRGNDGAVLGVATVDVTLSSMRRFFASPGTALNGEVFVTTRNGRLLFHSDEQRLLLALRQRGFAGTHLFEADPALLDGLLPASTEARSPTLPGWTVQLVATGPGSLQELRQLERLLRGVLLATLVLLGGTLVVVYRRVRSQRRRQAALEADLLRREQEGRKMERRRGLLEALVRRRTAELERINADKDRLMSMLAHDTRGDFMVIRSYAGMMSELIDGRDETALREACASLLASASHAYTNFEEILAWLELQSGGLECRCETLALVDVVAGACALAEPRAKFKGIVLSTGLAGVPPVRADRSMLATVLRNLLANAIKFTAEGGRVEVWASGAADAAGMVTVAVVDTGIGLAPAEAAAIFQAKGRRSRPGTAGEHGLGLGLSICEELCHKMAGRIWMESAVGRGTTVRFTLPLASGTGRS